MLRWLAVFVDVEAAASSIGEGVVRDPVLCPTGGLAAINTSTIFYCIKHTQHTVEFTVGNLGVTGLSLHTDIINDCP